MSNIVQFDPARSVSEREAKALEPIEKGGGGGNDGGMEARVAKLEAAIEYIQRDVGEIKVDLKTTNEAIRKFGDDVNVELRSIRNETSREFSAIRAEMKADFRALFAALIFSTLGLAGLMAKGFGWL